METLVAPPRTDYASPSCEQVIPGNVPPDDEKVAGTEPPEPLQGGAAEGDREIETLTGDEGTGP